MTTLWTPCEMEIRRPKEEAGGGAMPLSAGCGVRPLEGGDDVVMGGVIHVKRWPCARQDGMMLCAAAYIVAEVHGAPAGG